MKNSMPGFEPSMPKTSDQTGQSQSDLNIESLPKTEIQPSTPKDPIIAEAGQKAHEAVLRGVNQDLLSDTEKQVFREVAARHREAAEKAKEEEVQQRPEVLLVNKLRTIGERLRAQGLDRDAEIINGEATRLEGFIEQLSLYLTNHPEEVGLYQTYATHDHRHAIEEKTKREGLRETKIIYGLDLSVDLGADAHQDRSGIWYKDSDELEQHSESAKERGGLSPKLSEQALNELLIEFGILTPGENTEDLTTKNFQAGEHRNATSNQRPIAHGGRASVTEDAPGGYVIFSVEPGRTGGIEKRLYIHFANNFIINAALAKVADEPRF